MLLPLLMTTIAGLSTGLGGLIAALFRPTPRLMAFCGGFAGAVMLTVSLADLAPALLDFYARNLALHPAWHLTPDESLVKIGRAHV